MARLVYQKETPVHCSAEQLFKWHETRDALSKLLPPGEPVKILHHDGHVRDGSSAVLRVGHPPFSFRWELRHENYLCGEQFSDVQVRGPFRHWKHVHRMIQSGPNESILSDVITFELPFGPLGTLVGKWIIMPKLGKLFDYRHAVTVKECSR